MDLSDINKVASCRRLCTDVKLLKEKVSHETESVIKLRVAQDTAYWELKERLAAVQRDHERLQQNMVEVQMQLETVSARLQDELRMRPETLNKLASTRDICEVLEEYAGRVRASLQRTAADRALLSDAYTRASAAVADARAAAERRAHRAEADVRALRDQLKQSAEHAERLAACANAARQTGEAAAGEAGARLAAAAADLTRLRDRNEALAADMGHRAALLSELLSACLIIALGFESNACRLEPPVNMVMKSMMRENAITSLRAEIAQLKADHLKEVEKTKNEVSQLEREAGAASVLRTALKNAELRAQTAEEEIAKIREDITTVKKDREILGQRNHSLDQKLQEALETVDDLKQELKKMGDKNEDLVKILNEKDETICSLETYKSELRCEIETRTEQNELLVGEKDRALAELNETKSRADRLATAAAEATARAQELASQLASQRAEAKRAADNAERELNERAATVTTLMRDVQVEAEARNRLNETLTATRSDLESVRGERSRLEEDIKQLRALLQSKEDEVGAQMKIIINMRNEKEQLNEKILTLQQKIENIQDMTRDLPPARSRLPGARVTPEQDRAPLQQPAPVVAESSQKSVVRPDPSHDIFNFFTDSSLDNMDLDDPVQGRRRDAAQRNESLPTTNLRTLKRRRRLDSLHAEAKKRAERDSLSQLREAIAARPKTIFKTKRAGSPKKTHK